MNPWILIAIVAVAAIVIRSASKSSGLQAFAQAIAFAEGYGVDGAIPTTHNNPGDLSDVNGEIRTFDTPDAGWSALYELLQKIVDGTSTYYSLNMTISGFAAVYTATQQSAWTTNVVAGLQQQGYAVTSGTTIGSILLNQL